MKPIIYIIYLFILSLFSCTENLDDESPNIILIMADDQGWGQVSYYDHPVLDTPNLDAMAENGIRLTAFTQLPQCARQLEQVY